MATNSYNQTTVFGNFYALGFGDRIWPDVELQNWQKVENGLKAMNIENYLISRGVFSVDAGDASSGSVILSTSGLQAAFEGSINGSYFLIEDDLTWTISKLVNSKTYYIYLREVTGQTDPTSAASVDFDVFDYELTERDDKKTRLLMAIVTYDSVNGIVIADENPSGQLTANGFLSHITDSTNPHGSVLTQETLNVTTLNIGGKQSYAEHIYNETFTCGTDKTVDLRTVLGIDAGTDLEIKFIQVSVTGFGATPVDNYILWIEYDVGSDKAIFKIKTVGSTAYAMTARISAKYIINT